MLLGCVEQILVNSSKSSPMAVFCTHVAVVRFFSAADRGGLPWAFAGTFGIRFGQGEIPRERGISDGFFLSVFATVTLW